MIYKHTQKQKTLTHNHYLRQLDHHQVDPHDYWEDYKLQIVIVMSTVVSKTISLNSQKKLYIVDTK
jgi:hypothetical protein